MAANHTTQGLLASSGLHSGLHRKRTLHQNTFLWYMGVSSDAELEEIKSAYRRLSKLYHPDSTQLPLEIAGEKFMRLKDAYDTLSNRELRNLYDNRLANMIVSDTEGSLYGYPISSQEGYVVKTQKRPLGGQASSALAFDIFVLFVCICVILFVAFFKGHAST